MWVITSRHDGPADKAIWMNIYSLDISTSHQVSSVELRIRIIVTNNYEKLKAHQVISTIRSCLSAYICCAVSSYNLMQYYIVAESRCVALLISQYKIALTVLVQTREDIISQEEAVRY